MVLNFLKRPRRIGVCGASFKASQQQADERTTSDVTASQGSTCTASVAAWESLVERNKWDVIVQQVAQASSCTQDSNSSITITATRDDEVEVSDDNTSMYSMPSHSSRNSGCTLPVPFPLHWALAHGAPLKIVNALIAVLEKQGSAIPEESINDQGQTPLHVAVAAGCTEDVVHRLLNGPTLLMPAVVRDGKDRTALHVACAIPVHHRRHRHSRANFLGPNQKALDVWNKRLAIRCLVQDYPEATRLRDAQGLTPVEYAKQVGFSSATVHELEMAALRLESTAGGGDGREPCDEASSSSCPPVFLARARLCRSMSSLGMQGTEENGLLLGAMGQDGNDA